MAVNIEITADHSAEILRELDQKCKAALESCGQQAVSHAKQNITAGVPRHSGSWYSVTGALKNSMDHEVRKKVCYVGTNQDYAIYNEFGTGRFAEGGKGRKGWWVFVVGGSEKTGKGKTYSKEEALKVLAILKSKGLDAHMTEGMKPLHFLRNAIQDHVDEYKAIIEEQLKK